MKRPRLLSAGLLFVCMSGALVGLRAAAASGAGEPSAATPQIASKATLATIALKDVPGQQIANDRGMKLGGVGSDLFHGPGDAPGEYWMITDRGPNGQIKVSGKNRRTFPVPDFNPTILHVRAEGGSLALLGSIPISTSAGLPVTGLSNLTDKDETPYDYTAQTKLDFNQSGLDPEGLVRTSAGEFWLAEEYRPSLVHLDATGRVLKRYIPAGIALPDAGYPVSDTLPAIFDRRKSNRGFEGLGISPDEQTLYIALQSPLSNPTKSDGEGSRNTRILAFDIASQRVTAEYVYQFDEAASFDPATAALDNPRDEMKVSGVMATGPDTLVVLERTDAVAKLYQVTLSAEANILGSKWDDVATAPSLEQQEDLAAAQVAALPKTLVADLSANDAVPGKIEGAIKIGPGTYAIANDNDFDIGTFDDAGNNVGAGTTSALLVVKTLRELFLPVVTQ